MPDTTETCTEQISSRYARAETRSPFLCPAPDGRGGKCFHRLPCYVHGVEDERVGFLSYGSFYFVADGGEGPQIVASKPAPVPDWFEPLGYLDESAPIGYDGPSVIGDWSQAFPLAPWVGPPGRYPHPDAGRLASIAPWLTIHPDGKVLQHG